MKHLTRTFVRDILGAASHLAHAGWLVPAKLPPVWAFHGKSLPAVKSRSAPVPGTNSHRERKRMALASGARYVACRQVSFHVCPTVFPPSSGDGTPLRTAGQAGTGRGSRAAKPLLDSGRALAIERLMVVKPAPLKEESPGFNQGSVNFTGYSSVSAIGSIAGAPSPVTHSLQSSAQHPPHSLIGGVIAPGDLAQRFPLGDALQHRGPLCWWDFKEGNRWTAMQ